MNSKLKIALIALAVVIVLALGVLLISLLTGGGDEPENTAAPGWVLAGILLLTKVNSI